MKKVIIMKGLPGSGKSTYARKLLNEFPNAYKRINRDELRAMFDDGKVSRGNEKFVKQVRDLLIMKALESGKHVIVDDLNLSPKNENRIQQLVNEYKSKSGEEVKIEIHEMETSMLESMRRDAQREKPVGKNVIRKLARQFEKEGHRYRTQDESLPKAILCDLDGTLAILNGRDPFIAKDCFNDELNKPVADLVKLKAATGSKILLFSGRLDTYKVETMQWLEKYEIPYDDLRMRKAGDQRKDSIVKKEFFEELAGGKYYVEFVLDDRNQVVDLWRDELHLPCFQVYYGDF